MESQPQNPEFRNNLVNFHPFPYHPELEDCRRIHHLPLIYVYNV